MLQSDEDDGFFDADKELETEWLYEDKTSYRSIIIMNFHDIVTLNVDEGYCGLTVKEFSTLFNDVS